MSLITIKESSMIFGEFESDEFFCIEKCRQYTNNLSHNGVKIAEFILHRKNKLIFLEAKTTCPNAAVRDKHHSNRFKEYTDEIVEKLQNALDLYANIYLTQCADDDIPTKFTANNFFKNDTEKVFVLVVKSAETKWLIPYQEELNKVLQTKMKIWKIKHLLVINEEQAIRKNLAVPSQEAIHK